MPYISMASFLRPTGEKNLPASFFVEKYEICQDEKLKESCLNMLHESVVSELVFARNAFIGNGLVRQLVHAAIYRDEVFGQ